MPLTFAWERNVPRCSALNSSPLNLTAFYFACFGIGSPYGRARDACRHPWPKFVWLGMAFHDQLRSGHSTPETVHVTAGATLAKDKVVVVSLCNIAA
jgi:hypothetical protein